MNYWRVSCGSGDMFVMNYKIQQERKNKIKINSSCEEYGSPEGYLWKWRCFAV